MVSLPVDPQLVLQAALYFLAAGFGLVVSIPTAVTTSNFQGQCLLFTDVTWINMTHFTTKFGPHGVCHFVSYSTAFCCVLYGTAMGIYHCYAIYRSKKDKTIASQMWVMPFILSNSLVAIFTFLSGCLVTIGFNHFCNSYLAGRDTVKRKIKSCAAGENNVNWHQQGKKYKIETYYDFLHAARVAVWVCLILWLVQVALCIVRFLRNRRLRSEGGTFESGAGTASDKANFADEEPTA